MKISAVIPTYNNADYIEDAINSILAQSHPVDEIIIIDDGSSDNTEELVKVISKKAANIIYIKQANQGPSSARNRGIEAASGDWIAFLDADDLWTPDKIALQITALKNEPQLRLIAADMSEIDKLGKTIVESVLAKHQLLHKFQSLAGRAVPRATAALLTKNFIPTGTVLIERDCLRKTGGFNTNIRFGEDLELWARVAADHPITCLPQVMMQRRQHGDNATENTVSMLEGLVDVMQSLRHWGAEKLILQSLNPDRLVAAALCDLGYWHFFQGNYRQAREVFISSLKEQASTRALIYATACLLPNSLIRGIKALKQRSTKSP
ncbi:MAG: glycosyltransferase [Porticoccaceae bacterium]|nr:glycosyltransferase [Porticoccaceae bacterium]